MHQRVIWGLAVLISGPVAAETCKRKDDHGITSYDEKAPKGSYASAGRIIKA